MIIPAYLYFKSHVGVKVSRLGLLRIQPLYYLITRTHVARAIAKILCSS